MMSRLIALSKLRRFCSASFAKLDAAEGGTAQAGASPSATQATRTDLGGGCPIDDLIDLDESDLKLLEALDGIAAASVDDAQATESPADDGTHTPAEVRIEHDMVGQSACMREVYRFISKVAPADSTVLIYGESGTGKELAARAIHRNSPRASKPFVAINCAALTETLLESELFGHEKGAFTGAAAQRKGKLEAADGGTVFLDELGEMAPSLQAKLLRVLQEREFERVGGTRSVRVNIRVLAATNRSLEEAVREGNFRNDLYYRLNVVSFVMPPLRERGEDILLLANHFADKYGRKSNRRVSGLSAAARASLRDYGWPGNVRELENAIERAVVLGSADVIMQEDLPRAVVETEPSGGTQTVGYYDALKESKKHLIVKAIEQAGGNYTEAAKILGVHPNHLHRLVRTMNLRPMLKR